MDTDTAPQENPPDPEAKPAPEPEPVSEPTHGPGVTSAAPAPAGIHRSPTADMGCGLIFVVAMICGIVAGALHLAYDGVDLPRFLTPGLQKIETMEKRIRDLEQRVRTLESSANAADR